MKQFLIILACCLSAKAQFFTNTSPTVWVGNLTNLVFTNAGGNVWTNVNPSSGPPTYTLQDNYNLSFGGDGTMNYGQYYGSSDKWLASGKFTASSSYTVTKVDVNLNKTGTPTFNVRVHIYTVSGGVPNTDISTPSAWVSANQTWITSFTGISASLTSGQTYCIVLESDVVHGDGSNYGLWRYTFDGGNGTWYQSSSGSGWSNQSGNTRGEFAVYSSP